MFDSTSRYFPLAQDRLTVVRPDGSTREVAYVRRRFLPQLGDSVALLEHGVVQGDRLDNLASHYIGDPLQFWRICDANLVLCPPDLTDESGARIIIPLPTR